MKYGPTASCLRNLWPARRLPRNRYQTRRSVPDMFERRYRARSISGDGIAGILRGSVVPRQVMWLTGCPHPAAFAADLPGKRGGEASSPRGSRSPRLRVSQTQRVGGEVGLDAPTRNSQV